MLVERSPELITAVGVLVVPAFLTLILRCYVRITRRSFGKDDCCLVIAGLLYGWQTYEMVQGALDGIGVHDVLLADKPEKAMHALKHMFMIVISFTFCVLFIKLGIAYMLLRVAVNLVHLWLIRIVTAIYVVVSLAVDLYVILQCSPVEANWDYSLLAAGTGHCGPVSVVVNLTYLITATNIVTDWFYVGM
ncbi:putative integral membrane protein [Neofusicoccum parvum UCRNP2]|uniref:Putative integral membrane protein n=1 Tax=Botryosphaeria parva (strain UCR-NP2) TaxID=1287680 RepID=R1GSB8_BOTPV|nr:putative integral membrane protein [Neofusicoccum parvum UCRNP2]